MPELRSRTGLCILRIEAHATQLLVTVRTRPNVQEAAGEQVCRTVDIDTAMRAVRDFLVEFICASER